MPSTPTLARRRGPRPIGFVAALLIALAMVLGSAPTHSIAVEQASGTAPQRPPATPAAGVALDLVSLGPTALTPGSTLTAQVQVTNGTDTTIAEPVLELRARTPRVTERSTLDTWQRDTTPAVSGTADASSTSGAPALAPGESRTVTVSVAADSLGFSSSPDLWGTRRLALTLASGGEDLATLRTFTVWRPAGTTASISESVLLPVSADDAGEAALDPAGYDASATGGHLRAVADLATRPDVDWLLDPALVDPPALAVPADEAEAGAGDPQADPSAGTTTADASPTPEGTGRYARSEAAQGLVDELTGAVGERTVLTTPYARADLVSLDAAGASDLADQLSRRSQEALSSAGITSAGTVVEVPADEADGQALTAAQETGADVLMTSSASLREEPDGIVTPSSIGAYASDAGTTPVLAPDPVLSDELSSITAGSDGEQTTQRMLAETAVIASEPTSSPRHVLISPTLADDADAGAMGRTLDALGEAPWVQHERTGDVLGLAADADWTTDSQDGSTQAYALGTLHADAVHPTSRSADGSITRLEEPDAPGLLGPGVLLGLQEKARALDTLRSAMQDPAQTDAADLAVASATSVRWRGTEAADAFQQRVSTASDQVDALTGAVTIVPASGYNLVASDVNVPVTVVNNLDSAVTVSLAASSDKPLLRVSDDLPTVTVPARGQESAPVHVEAVANGDVTLSVRLTDTHGRPLTESQEMPLTVNPAWENWTTMLIVIAMGLLVVVGVLRARRHGSDRRAPAVRGPENSDVLAHTGRSELAARGKGTDADTPQPPNG
ncbi:DUF6049 family protein [Brachybacterium huguangmaarense]|uniref:DUF6049 family protein n=1 Tax=Brachybacterium huguangmaarense TaxID=1652028 RepID=A0ABY6G4T5_9MICO|nr:DUF6049 family protein [Brachybacterium huguangmaarense]UYG17641.1 DUF6049 family protein [Brachybacterium huguangmaarense]